MVHFSSQTIGKIYNYRLHYVASHYYYHYYLFILNKGSDNEPW